MTRGRLGYLAATILRVVFASAALTAAVTADEMDRVHVFSIKAQPLADALLDFSRQAEQQVVGASDVIGPQHTQGVSGRLTSRAALEQLLDKTGLAFDVVDERTVRIYAKPASASGVI